ncbi:uncharacterized protein LOC119272880 [Triticum dicoccoides]|uniref:uncharacterized protein LOC119272880 n=1 Tax=Triticum dicoccoides TaxID=85692 RepID=UPI000E788E59|nr:uncharacterized protein LOC119272880 [Triticum dicoccoides]
MAGPTDLLKPERFGGENFKRWQTRVKFWLMSLNLWWVISPQLPLTQEQQREIEVSSDTTLGCLLSLLTHQLCDIYMSYTSPSELWEALVRKYEEADAGRELYVNELYHDFHMVDSRSVVEQSHELQLLVGELGHFGSVLPDKFVVGGIIAKLPLGWRGFATSLKHRREAMTVEGLIATLDVEEKARAKDVPQPSTQDTSTANLVDGGAGGSKNIKNKGKGAKQTTGFKKKKKTKGDFNCFVCGEAGHLARKCRMRKGKKVNQQTVNVTVGEPGEGSGLAAVPPS